MISRFGGRFGPAGTELAVREIAAIVGPESGLRFTGFQPEVFELACLSDWTSAATDTVVRVASENGLQPTQFVAHFAGTWLTTMEGLRDPRQADALARAMDVAARFSDLNIVSIPLLAWKSPDAPFADAWAALCERIACWCEHAQQRGLRLALEVVPGSLVGSTFGLQRLCTEIGGRCGADLGFTLDTGHAHAGGEVTAHAIERMAGRMTGTHLCDNNGEQNTSSVPGEGTIDWSATLAALQRSGYSGSLDLEIVLRPGSSAEAVGTAYAAGLDQLAHYIPGLSNTEPKGARSDRSA